MQRFLKSLNNCGFGHNSNETVVNISDFTQKHKSYLKLKMVVVKILKALANCVFWHNSNETVVNNSDFTQKNKSCIKLKMVIVKL